MEILGRQECLQNYNLSMKWFYAMCNDGFFIKIGRNQYVPQKTIDVEAYKQMHEQRRKEKIRQSNINYAKAMTTEERQLMNEKLSKAQKRYFSNPENREKHRQRQKEIMSSIELKPKLSKANKDKWKRLSEERKKTFRQTISNAVRASWNDTNTRQNRIDGLRKAYKDRKDTIVGKIHNTKLLHGSYGTSRPAEYCINILKQKGYTIETEKQYPHTNALHCDAYIVELDYWIEFHYFWTHGNEPFDKNNEHHIKLLEDFKSRNTKQYNSAIYTWSYLDVKKLNIAKKEGLKYYCFYNVKDFEDFLIQNKL